MDIFYTMLCETFANYWPFIVWFWWLFGIVYLEVGIPRHRLQFFRWHKGKLWALYRFVFRYLVAPTLAPLFLIGAYILKGARYVRALNR